MEEEAAARLPEGLLFCLGARPERHRHLSRRLEGAQGPRCTLERNLFLARRAAGWGLRTATRLACGAPPTGAVALSTKRSDPDFQGLNRSRSDLPADCGSRAVCRGATGSRAFE